ncbi:MAG: ribonuclease P protein component [Paludibacteraceae bacterium]|nr:ribonuclease P protein component [Paludibacteraceae bacterium]
MRIAQLYKEGQRFTVWPLRVTYQPIANGQESDQTGNSQVLVWAPKSIFKHAVHRNHLRRLMREAYRQHQEILAKSHYIIAFNYIDKEELSYAVIEKAMVKALNKITNHQ